MRTAREYPTVASYSEPDDTLRRFISHKLVGGFRSVQQVYSRAVDWQPRLTPVGILLGFAPWIVYWVLVGNVPFATAVLVAFAIAVLSFVIGRVKGAPGRTLEIGAIATFLVLTVLTFTLSDRSWSSGCSR